MQVPLPSLPPHKIIGKTEKLLYFQLKKLSLKSYSEGLHEVTRLFRPCLFPQQSQHLANLQRVTTHPQRELSVGGHSLGGMVIE